MTDFQIWIASILAGMLASGAYGLLRPKLPLPEGIGRTAHWAITIGLFLLFAFFGHLVSSSMTRAVGGALTVSRDTGLNQQDDSNTLDGYVNQMEGR